MRKGIAVVVLLAAVWGATGLFSSEPAAVRTFPDSAANQGVFSVGEKLVYNVRYGFISLGKITVTVTGTEETEEGMRYTAEAEMQSYSGVPFVSLHHIYTSGMSPDFYSHWFKSLERDKSRWLLMRYEFDYDDMQVIVEEGKQEEVEVVDTVDTLAISDYYQDGLSLFFFARGYVTSDRLMTIPTMVNKDVYTTDFTFNGGKTSKKIKAIGYPVEVTEFSGRANFSGIFGLTGAFRGWFSSDEAAIPIEAKLRVIIGNITVELIEWDRPGWNPPRYASND
jgi:hypothetical protein